MEKYFVIIYDALKNHAIKLNPICFNYCKWIFPLISPDDENIISNITMPSSVPIIFRFH